MARTIIEREILSYYKKFREGLVDINRDSIAFLRPQEIEQRSPIDWIWFHLPVVSKQQPPGQVV